MNGDQVQLRSFLQGTALRKLSGPRIYAPNGVSSGITQGILPRNGYGAHIRLNLHVRLKNSGTINFKDSYIDEYDDDGRSGPEQTDLYGSLEFGRSVGEGGDSTMVATKQHIYRLLENIQLHNNKGLTPINCSAFDLAMVASRKRYGVENIIRNVRTINVGSDTIIQATVDLPLAPNLGRAALWGLIGLQSNTAEWTVKIQWKDIKDIVNTATGTYDCEAYVDSTLYYFDVPNPSAFEQPPLSYAYMIRGQTVPGGSINSGDWFFELSPLGGTLMRLLVNMNDKQGRPFETHRGDYLPVPDNIASVKRMRTVIDNTDFLWDISALEHENWHMDVYGKMPFSGWFTFLDGMTVLDTQVGEFIAPDFMHGFISPSNYASVKAVAQLDLNGAEAGECRVVQEYLQALRV